MTNQPFTTKAAFETYVDYLALTRHFSSDQYDYHKYNGKIRASFDTFSTHRSLPQFYYVSKFEDPHGLLLSNISVKPKIWIGNLLDKDAKTIYKNWKKRNQSLGYEVDTALNQMDDSFFSYFTIKNGEYPELLNMYMSKKVSLEALCLLVKLPNALPLWEKKVSDRIIAGDIFRLVRKYTPFIDYDMKLVEDKVKTNFDL